jgi:methionyl-tRNA formyltransferase
LKVVFLCGHHSDYGACHLRPLLASRFETVAVVLASDTRWSTFRRALEVGRDPLPDFSDHRRFRRQLARLAPATLRRMLGVRGPAPVDVLGEAKRAAVPVRSTDDVNSTSFLGWLRNCGAELVLSAAYPQIFGPDLLRAVKHGCVNFHPSLLPQFRGAYPHFWALATGAERGGVSAHRMTEKLDAGALIAQIGFPLDGLDHLALHERLCAETARLVEEVADRFIRGDGRGWAQG